MPPRNDAAVGDSGEFTLVSSDNHYFHIPLAARGLSSVIDRELDRLGGGDLRLPNYNGDVLEPVAGFLRGYGNAGDDERERRIFNIGYFPGAPDLRVLFDALLAAADLEIPTMVDVVSRRIAGRIKGESVAWVKGTFEIQTDVPAWRVAEIESEHPWAFENIDRD